MGAAGEARRGWEGLGKARQGRRRSSNGMTIHPRDFNTLVVQRKFFESQPGRRKFARDPRLDRAWRSKRASRRPVCGLCHRIMPGPDEPRDDYLEPFGHRTPSGDPCRGEWLLPEDYAAYMAAVKAAEPPALVAVGGQLRLFAVPAAPPVKRKRAPRVTWRQASAQQTYEQVRLFA